MKNRELHNLGIGKGEPISAARACCKAAAENKVPRNEIRATVTALAKHPELYLEDEHFAPLAKVLNARAEAMANYVPREDPAPYQIWGEGIEPTALEQIDNACSLPVSVAGALMPDAHQGYGLPIGGVLATRGAVIPYAVGVDIACRMKLSVLDMPVASLKKDVHHLKRAIEDETRFGIGAEFKNKREHPVLEADWSISPVTSELKGKAWRQLGSSGSGNHFVEFGTLTFDSEALGMEPGVYLALLSHSGSRGTGASVADYYSKLAMDLHPELPNKLKHLAWLALDHDTGREYWAAMELMGQYAAANHALIHHHIARNLGAEVLLDVENHHNFAWRETHLGEELIVHRKGATPAAEGVLGIIPGSMATPGYLVCGKGKAASLHSCSHGAGRAMSRRATKQRHTWHEAKRFLRERDVTLISAGLDEIPMAYKDIETVMAAQNDLIETLARFDPRLVKMAPEGERPED